MFLSIHNHVIGIVELATEGHIGGYDEENGGTVGHDLWVTCPAS